ncbi:MAG: ABC transporter permease subunit, partial [Pirellulales bacterium]|nr:ABC transporter permease subunit [Pirellulales bacterium]
ANGKVGDPPGLFSSVFGVALPDWFSWGPMPTTIVLVLHYFPIAFLLLYASLSTIRSDLPAAANLVGAGHARILAAIIGPIALPAAMTAFILCFAGAVSNFSAPAILGSPVRYYTIATRLYGLLQSGQTERGYALALLLLVISLALIPLFLRFAHVRADSLAQSQAPQSYRVAFGRHTRRSIFLAILCLLLIITGGPMLALFGASLSDAPGLAGERATLHYWIGASTPERAEGLAGILRNPEVFRAAFYTFAFAGVVAVLVAALGFLAAYVEAGSNSRIFGVLMGYLTTAPLFMPPIILSAACLALFGGPLGPIPPLYGTFMILVIAGLASQLPYGARASRAALTAVPRNLDSAARIAGAGVVSRIVFVMAPSCWRSIVAGMLLAFVRIIRSLDLVIFIYTPAIPLLSVLAFRYTLEGFMPFSYAIS